MLSSESAAVIRATLPAVGVAIGDITVLFYRNMFAAHPELERDLFNRSRQRHFVQQKALAQAIATFAALQIDPATDDDKVRTMLMPIAHKHASLGITTEQYQIVHKYLFEAIVEVLGAAVTPAVAKAWDEVYWLMAGTLTALEADLYHSAGLEPGGVWRIVAVRQRVIESADSVTFVLCSLDGSLLPQFSPGQYLSVGVRLPDGARQIRQYSLINASCHDGEWRIRVKCGSRSIAPDGTELDTVEVSNFLYNNVFEGDTLEVSAPFGALRSGAR